MRIAFFGDAQYVGAWEWIRFLADQPDFEVHAIVFRGHEREMPRVRLHTLTGPLPRGKMRYLLCVPALRRALARIRPDLFIAYRAVSYGFSAAMTGFHPLVLAAQGMMIASRATPYATRLFARRAVRAADLLHAWAPIMAENMVHLGADPSRILTLTRGVDDRAYAPGPVPPPPLTLVTTRQLEPYYNFPTVLEALRIVKGEIGDFRYRIAGQGSLRGALEAMAREKGIAGNVEFLGAVSRERLPEIVRSSHLYIAAVPTDGTSSSMLEAMAAGAVPVVADNPSNRHWVEDGVGGRLVPAFDPTAFAAAVREAWADSAWRERARTMNRKTVESRASWHRNMPVFLQAYRDLAAGKRPPAAMPTLRNSVP